MTGRVTTDLLRIVVLQTDLEVDSLRELPLLVSAGLQHSPHTLVESLSGDFTHPDFCNSILGLFIMSIRH